MGSGLAAEHREPGSRFQTFLGHQSRLTSIAAHSETTREFSRLRRGRGGAVGGGSVVLLALGAAFDAGGGEPGVELGGIAAVEVLHHGVEAGDFLGALVEKEVDGLGAFEAFEVVGGGGDFFAIDGGAVGAEVFDEVGGDELADEFGAEGGFFRKLGRGVGEGVFEAGEQGVGVELDVALGGFAGEAVEGGESGRVEVDGAGGAGDVPEVGPKGVEQGLETGGPTELADFEAVELAGEDGDVAEAANGFATGGQVGEVFDAEDVDAVEAVVAEDVAGVHGEDVVMILSRLLEICQMFLKWARSNVGKRTAEPRAAARLPGIHDNSLMASRLITRPGRTGPTR